MTKKRKSLFRVPVDFFRTSQGLVGPALVLTEDVRPLKRRVLYVLATSQKEVKKVLISAILSRRHPYSLRHPRFWSLALDIKKPKKVKLVQKKGKKVK